jgi:hypothetical protein
VNEENTASSAIIKESEPDKIRYGILRNAANLAPKLREERVFSRSRYPGPERDKQLLNQRCFWLGFEDE